MRKRNDAKRNVLIDLTSLLDVVFIVLLVVVCQLQNTKQNNDQAVLEANEAQESAEAAKRMYEDQADSLGNISDYIIFISINSHYEANLTTRHINLLCSDKEITIPEISDLKGTEVEGYTELRSFIQGYAAENSSRTIVLSLNENDEKILYRDEKAIKNIFNDLCAAYSNVKQKD